MEQQVGTNQLSFRSKDEGIEIEAQGSEGFLLGVVELIAKLSVKLTERVSQKGE